MAIGMSYDEYWNGESSLVSYYYKAHKYRIEQTNQEMWVMGMYMASAISSTVGNMFSSKGSKRINYLEEPLQLFPKTKKEIEKDTEKERQKAIESFKRLQSSMNIKFNGETKCQ